jgi:hypothetical protein
MHRCTELVLSSYKRPTTYKYNHFCFDLCQVIERKLVNVSTPSTAADSNIGADAVHLLALKEVCLLLTKQCSSFGPI